MPTIFTRTRAIPARARQRGVARVDAFSRTIVTRNDDGRAEFNKSQVIGQLIADGISTSYHPAQDRSANAVALNWAVDMGYSGAFNILSELYPGPAQRRASSPFPPRLSRAARKRLEAIS